MDWLAAPLDGPLGIVPLALAVGGLHALDADHVMAVTNLASRRPALREAVTIAARWALGHGGVLLMLGLVVYVAGQAIPDALAQHTERLVALVLVGLGVHLLTVLWRSGARLRLHRHPGHGPHLHWATPEHTSEPQDESLTRARHGALLVGSLHGLAGSAPLLALLTAGQLQRPELALLYVASFSLGVLLVMCLFGGLLGSALAGRPQVVSWLRAGAGVGAVGVGAVMVVGTL